MIFLKKLPLKFKVYIVLVLVFIGMAYAYKFKLAEDARIIVENDENVGKTIVSVWLKDSTESETRRNQIERYNDENVDNIFINLK